MIKICRFLSSLPALRVVRKRPPKSCQLFWAYRGLAHNQLLTRPITKKGCSKIVALLSRPRIGYSRSAYTLCPPTSQLSACVSYPSTGWGRLKRDNECAMAEELGERSRGLSLAPAINALKGGAIFRKGNGARRRGSRRRLSPYKNRPRKP